MNRKDEHIFHALAYESTYNSFDDMKLDHYSISNMQLSEINIETKICGIKLTSPFFINAMTGGSAKAKEINKRLATIASATNLVIATGSYSAALKNSNEKDSFQIIHQIDPTIPLITNIGADKDYSYALRAVQETNAKAIQIHLNVMQELLMPEGERNFSEWKNNIKNVLNHSSVPVIIKEVGFGMNSETISTLIQLGAQTIDVSGKGGTSFSYIENCRSKHPISYLNDWGISTVNSLLNSQPYQSKCDFIASGGIRNALDIIKCLILGAKAVGISGTILKWLHQYNDEEIIVKINELKKEIRILMCALNCANIESLKSINYFLVNQTLSYYNQITKKNV